MGGWNLLLVPRMRPLSGKANPSNQTPLTPLNYEGMEGGSCLVRSVSTTIGEISPPGYLGEWLLTGPARVPHPGVVASQFEAGGVEGTVGEGFAFEARVLAGVED